MFRYFANEIHDGVATWHGQCRHEKHEEVEVGHRGQDDEINPRGLIDACALTMEMIALKNLKAFPLDQHFILQKCRSARSTPMTVSLRASV